MSRTDKLAEWIALRLPRRVAYYTFTRVLAITASMAIIARRHDAHVHRIDIADVIEQAGHWAAGEGPNV